MCAARRAARQADHRAARIRIPMRAAESGEGGHEIDAACIWDARGQRFDVGRAFDNAEPVPQPLHDGAADEHGAFQRIAQVRRLPGDGRQQPVARRQRRRAGVHQQEAARAVRVLGHAGLEAGLAEQRRLLVARDPRNGNASGLRAWRSVHRRRATTRTTCGSTARGMRNRSSMKSSHWALVTFSSSVRLALDTSVTCRSPLVSCHTSQLSIVPKASSPFSAR